MIKYAKVINKETGLCEVGLGTNSDFYESIGMTLQDVEQSDIDNNWYLSELCPRKTDDEKLAEAKEQKTQVAKDKAYDFLANGNALFEFEEGKHIEATDGNIAKFTAYLIGFEKGLYEVVRWNTKEDENVELNFEQVSFILQGLANVQSDVWTYKYPYYLDKIEQAQTVEEVENIVIDYDVEVDNGIEL